MHIVVLHVVVVLPNGGQFCFFFAECKGKTAAMCCSFLDILVTVLAKLTL